MIHETETINREDAQFARYAQLGLRLLGLMLVVDGLALFITNAFALMQYMDYGELPSMQMQIIGLIAIPAVQVGAGLHFALDGRWVLENVLLRRTKDRVFVDDDEIERDTREGV